MSNTILKIENLKTYFPVYKGLFIKRQIDTLKAVNDVSLTVNSGDSMGLVGESGCGKSTLAKSLIKLKKTTSGKILFKGTNITDLSESKLRKYRTSLQIVFQDPYASLNPRMTVFDILAEPILEHKLVPKKQLFNRISELMNAVGLSPKLIKKYPHEFSGGQRQRIAIARALAVNPQLLIADEPVSALDVSVQAQILNLLIELQKKFNLTLLFISHNLAVVKYICNKVAIMYAGEILEIGDTESIFDSPAHPYTQALIDAVPEPDPNSKKKNKQQTMRRPNGSSLQQIGCIYYDHCPNRTEICSKEQPKLNFLSETHQTACHHAPGRQNSVCVPA